MYKVDKFQKLHFPTNKKVFRSHVDLELDNEEHVEPLHPIDEADEDCVFS